MSQLSMNTYDDNIDSGSLVVSLTSSKDARPIPNATVKIYDPSEPESDLSVLITDSSGQTISTSLPTPKEVLSLSPGIEQPYAEYNLSVEADGFLPVYIAGAQLLSDCLSLQPVILTPADQSVDPISDADRSDESETFPDVTQRIVIPAHTLFGDYPAKIPEDEIKPMDETGEIVLSQIVIPEYIIVHDGVPEDSTAKNYRVRYRDYIKNVACNEIYPTWPESALYANILAIMSFTLNRVYTEWYRNRGYNFTITSSTAYDHKWVYGRTIFDNIDYLVDSVFANYLSRPGVKQPIFTSYCDGNRTSCKGMSQWGSKALADQGYSAIQILRYYYGNDLYINTATMISGVPSSYPGYELTIGSTGDKVRQLQTQLNRIGRNYPAIPSLVTDGIYGPKTQASVKAFQRIFNLPSTGVTDYATWYEISEIFVAVSRIAEPS